MGLPDDSSHVTFWKRPSYGDSKGSVAALGLREGKHGGLSGQFDGHLSLYICANPEDTQCRVTLK